MTTQAPLDRPTGALALADGTVFEGVGFGARGEHVGEVCFNTAITGYQEILTDPSYAQQIITFTFPHIGNVGTNDEDGETANPAGLSAARGAILRAVPTAPSNYRARSELSAWLKRYGIIGLAGVDTRALTRRIRENGMPHGVIAHQPDGRIDRDRMIEMARAWNGIEGADLAKPVTTQRPYPFAESRWTWPDGFARLSAPKRHIVVIDYGAKTNILRCLGAAGARTTVVSAETPARDILALKPDGVMLSNGPGDPAATAEYAAPILKDLMEANVPLFGICLGHQILALSLGAKTQKMLQGHHGANHPVKDLETGKVEIVSMNHGFTVDRESLPENVEETHISLFDGTNCGLRHKGGRAFSVQYHPEASPGPNDSFYLFDRFLQMMT